MKAEADGLQNTRLPDVSIYCDTFSRRNKPVLMFLFKGAL
jgi:hypothetical protein